MGFLLPRVTPSLLPPLPPKPGVPKRHFSSSALQPDTFPKGLSVLDGLQPLLAETLPGHRAQQCTSPAWEDGALHGSVCGSCPVCSRNNLEGPRGGLLIP